MVTLWAIWTARRKAIHEEIFRSPLSTHCFIQAYLADLQLSQPSSAPTVRLNCRPSRSWVRPEADMIKINVDGAFARNGRCSAAAAVCRDYNGAFLGSSAMVFNDINDPATLESLACREALSLADDLLVERIHVASDCKGVVEDITNGTLR